MSGRAFYQIGLRADPQGCVVLHRDASNAYLHSPTDPHPGLEAAGATRLAGDWDGLWKALGDTPRDGIFRATISRLESQRSVQRTVLRSQVLQTDTVLSDRLPPHKFAGDPDPEPVE